MRNLIAFIAILSTGILLISAGVFAQSAQQANQPPASSAQKAGPAIAQPGAKDDRGKGELAELPVPPAKSFKTDDGKDGWRLNIPGNRPLATPAVVNGIIFVGGGFGSHEFYALDAKTGKRVWTFRCGDDGPTAAVAGEGYVAYNTESCTIYIQDQRTGKVIWHKWLGDPLMSQPAIGADKVFMAYPGEGGHHLGAFELKTGKVSWDKKIAAEVITAPVVAGDDVLVATVDGTLFRFDLATGKLRWSKDLRVTSAPRVVGDKILISQRGQKEIQIKDKDGKAAKSTVAIEGLNIVAIKDGATTAREPIAAVQASFLLALEGQQQIYSGNANVALVGQGAYRNSFGATDKALASFGGANKAKADELRARIKKVESRKASDKPELAQKDAEDVLALTKELNALANSKPGNDDDAKAQRELQRLSGEIQAKAENTKEAASAATQAAKTIIATRKQGAKDQAQDSSVGFADAPAGAKLDKAAGNIGQSNVKSVWAYQGSRPCLYKGLSIMVHGPHVQAVEVATGKAKWNKRFDFKEEENRPVTPPALAGGKLYLGTVSGLIVCLDAQNGKQLWQSKVGGRILFEPAVVDGCVYVATDDGALICLKTADKSADGWAMWGGSARHNGGEK